ncbi:MAG: T9SS type A sorting domain-containing protein [Bacteroidaceae bacterium]|nr:T9SS type A sorting domain-containing protein [Bacteroidaceae bacterium]
MKKTNYILTMLFAVLFYVTGAQRANAADLTIWDGNDLPVTLKAGASMTFSYTATEQGYLYIYAPTASTSLGLTISGGLYKDDAYVSKAAFDIAEPYDNGAGVFATIHTSVGDEIRFTIKAATSKGSNAIKETSFTLQSKTYADSYGGDSKNTAIEIPFDTTVDLPIYENLTPDYLKGFSHTTFIRFTASVDGLASLVTSEYLIYYIDEDEYGYSPMKYAVQAEMTDDHEFPIERYHNYIVMIPNIRPTSVTLKLTADTPGQLATYPIDIESFPTTLSLSKGNNWYRMNVKEMDAASYIMDVATNAGWTGNISYWNDANNINDWLCTDTINGSADLTIAKNIHLTRLGTSDYFYLNVYSEADVANALTLTLRQPKNEGEDFTTAKSVQVGDNTFSSTQYENWFTFTATRDVQLEITADTLLSYICYDGNEANMMNEFNLYRVYEGETLYICVKTPDTNTHTLTIKEYELVVGDYCDLPIDFLLGNDIVIEDRGEQIMNYRRFIAEESGSAIFETTCSLWVENAWSVVFRSDCDGKALDFKRSEYEDENTGDLGLSYELSITKGQTYIIEITSFTNDGNEAILHTTFKGATDGTNYETALPIPALNEQVTIPNTPNLTRWFSYVADQTGFYTIKSKIGQGSTMRTMVGENVNNMVNSITDDSYEEAYMAGYKLSKIYVEEGTRFYVCIQISSNPGTTAGTNRYLSVSFAEARPGEYFGSPIEAEVDEIYYLPNTADAYDTWYTFIIPATVECIFTVGSDITPAYGSLHFYADEHTAINASDETYAMESLKDANDQLCGKRYTFAPADTVRVIYIKAEYQQNLHWWNVALNIETSINETQVQSLATIATNHADGTFAITTPVGCSVVVSSINGQSLYQAHTTESQTIVTPALAKGIYLITITQGSVTNTFKVIM